MSIWFEESLYENIKLRIEVKQVLVDCVTSHGQRACIFETVKHGRVFCLDNIIQCAESDEFYYHEIMAHIPLTSMGDAQNIAIVGGASGAMAREVLKHKSCRTVDMVDIDGENIELCKLYMPQINQNCFNDDRLRVHVADAYYWLENQIGTYDLIIVDSPDPIGSAEKLFSSNFYKRCLGALKSDGVLVCQAGVPFFQQPTYNRIVDDLSAIFHYSGSFSSSIPLFIGGNMKFVWGSHRRDLNACMDAHWEARAKEISIRTKHYDLNVHRAALDPTLEPKSRRSRKSIVGKAMVKRGTYA